MTVAALIRDPDDESTRVSISGHTVKEICCATTILFNALVNTLVDLESEEQVQILRYDQDQEAGRAEICYMGQAPEAEAVFRNGCELLNTQAPDKFRFRLEV